MAKGKGSMNRKRKNDRFLAKHPGMTRKEWAKYKKENGLPKIVANHVR